jgi:ATP-dependent Lon protease
MADPNLPRIDSDKAGIDLTSQSIAQSTADLPLDEELAVLMASVEKAELPTELHIKLKSLLLRLNRSIGQAGYLNLYEEVTNYIDWVVSLPWSYRNQDNLDLRTAQDVLNQSHYGLLPIKQRILEHLSVLILQSQANAASSITRSPVLCFVGLPGIGKTSIAFSIAESLGRPFIRIPMGGMGTAKQLRGQPRSLAAAEPGQIIKSLRRVKVKNPVILLDEIDRTAESARAEIMGVLLELLDPEQNTAFSDNFIDYPFDLSEALFLASANNTSGIANAVLDRLEIIQMPGYSDEEKIHIARNYLFPRQLKFATIPEGVITVDEAVWPMIIRPLGFDAGIRTTERVINGIVRKIALQIVSGAGQQFTITPQNLKQYLPAW